MRVVLQASYADASHADHMTEEVPMEIGQAQPSVTAFESILATKKDFRSETFLPSSDGMDHLHTPLVAAFGMFQLTWSGMCRARLLSERE